MNISRHIMEMFDVFSTDEELLRLLYYPSKNLSDDPLSPDKDSILGLKNKWTIIDDRIKFTMNTDGLTDSPDQDMKSRICFYAGGRRRTRNKFSKDQIVVVDVLTHKGIHGVDLRMYKISERIWYLIKTSKFSSFGEVEELDSNPSNFGEFYSVYTTEYKFGEFTDK